MSKPAPPALTSTRWGSRTKRIVSIVILVMTGFIVITVSDVLPLLVVAALLSYLLWPLANLFENRILAFLPFRSRSLAVLLMFITVIAVIVVALIVILPVLVNQIAEAGRNIPQFLEEAEVELQRILSQPIMFNGAPVLIDGEPVIPLERLESVVGEDGVNGLLTAENFDIFQILGTFLGSLGGPAFSVVGDAINAVINLTFLLVIIFYLTRDGEQFIGRLVQITPEAYRGDVRRLLYELGRVWNAYLRGQLILSITVGVAVYLAALLLGLSSAPILGLLSGLLEFIPNLGPFLALLPAAFIALVTESSTIPFLGGITFMLTVIVVWVIIQQVESVYLVPRVMGGSLKLHPVAVVIAVLAGASLAGALGVILAAPFMATIRVLGQYFYGKLFDTEPFARPQQYDEVLRQRGRFYRTLRSFLQRRLRRRSRRQPAAQPLQDQTTFTDVTEVKKHDG